jgi:hypothetical protein
MRPSINFTAVLRGITTITQRSSQLRGGLFRRVAPPQRHTNEMFIQCLSGAEAERIFALNFRTKRIIDARLAYCH